jgi:hypothetical protein
VHTEGWSLSAVIGVWKLKFDVLGRRLIGKLPPPVL